mgnify:CR=1 FL=1
MAIDSAKAAPSSIGTKILPADSGLRPIDSMALLTMRPMATFPKSFLALSFCPIASFDIYSQPA